MNVRSVEEAKQRPSVCIPSRTDLLARSTEVDVLVAGGGNAGLCAALSAREAGARVLLVERSPEWRRGGNSRHTRDVRYAHSEGDAWATAAYPREEFLADLREVSGAARTDLAELLVASSESLPSWMEHQGVRWQRPLRGALHLDTNRFFLGGGKAMMATYYRRAQKVGVDILYGRSVTQLETTSGRVVAVTLKGPAGTSEVVRPRALVIASGGLEGNRQWLEKKYGTSAQNILVRGTPDNDGSLLLDLMDAGAALAGSSLFHCLAVDARAPAFDGGIVTRVDSIPLGIVLNRGGRRFYDEGEDTWPKRYAQWGHLILHQPGQIAYSIFDNKAWGSFIPPLYPPLQADTLEQLVALIDIDRPVALESIATYNAAVDTTTLFDASRLDGRRAIGLEPCRSNWARAIDSPPYFAFPLKPGLTFTYTSVAVDTSAHVLREDGSRFANIFAAGESMAGNILVRGYLAGVGLTIGSVFGRIAGGEAAHV